MEHFRTELEPIENAFVLTVKYGYRIKQWSYRIFEDAIVHRSRIEHYYVEGKDAVLNEEML